MHTILKGLMVTLLMLEAAGCGCSEVGCSDGFGVAFSKVSKVWEPGSYVVSAKERTITDAAADHGLSVRVLPDDQTPIFKIK